MRKAILLGLMMATAIPTAAYAQRGELRHDRREVRQDRREVVQDRRELRRDRARYVSPYRGWNYRRVNRGYVLRPVFWGPRYVIDYRYYHLRAPYGYQRWIRYGDDLLLVDIRNGRVLEVLYGRY